MKTDMEREGEAAKERSSFCFRGCCSSDRIPLAIVPASSLTILSEVARGAESVVYEATLKGQVLVAKKPRLSTSEDIDRYHRELQLLTKIEHPNIIKLVAAHAQPPNYSFLFPLYEQGNLSHALHIREWIPTWKEVAKISIQLASAICYLHNMGVIHRDIKPANILLDAEWNAYLGDFGLAMPIKDIEGISVENWKSIGKPTGGFHKKNMVGTLLYMAPEVLKKEVHTEKADVYGFAITINELATGVVPYTDRRTEAQAHTVLEMNYTEQQLTASITSGLRPVLANSECGIPSRLSTLIEKCWSNNPHSRPHFTEVIEELQEIFSTSIVEAKRNIKIDSNVVSESLHGTTFHYNKDFHENAIHETKETPFTLGQSWLKPSNYSTTYVPTFSWGSFATRGGRDTMEDHCFLLPHLGGSNQVHLFGILDGHRGGEAAEYATHAIPHYLMARSFSERSPAKALSAAFVETDKAFREELDLQRPKRKGQGKNWHPGCTAISALFVNDTLIVANAGDCRAVLCRNGQAIALSKDHTASSVEERERVVKLGGQVKWQVDTWRVGAAALQVTRSIGDDDLKPAVTAEPEMMEITLTEEDEFLVIASDGLWDKVGNEEAIHFVKNTVKEASMSSKRLATEAVERGSSDNITVIIIFLRPVSTLERVY